VGERCVPFTPNFPENPQRKRQCTLFNEREKVRRGYEKIYVTHAMKKMGGHDTGQHSLNKKGNIRKGLNQEKGK